MISVILSIKNVSYCDLFSFDRMSLYLQTLHELNAEFDKPK